MISKAIKTYIYTHNTHVMFQACLVLVYELLTQINESITDAFLLSNVFIRHNEMITVCLSVYTIHNKAQETNNVITTPAKTIVKKYGNSDREKVPFESGLSGFLPL